MTNFDNKKAIKDVEKIVSEYGRDKRKLISKLQGVVKEGKSVGDLFLVGLAYYYISIAYNDISDRNGLLTYSLKAVELLKDSDEYEIIAKAYLALGYAHAEKVNYQMALVCYEQSAKIISEHRIQGEAKLSVLNNLSTCYHELGDVQKSIKILNECIKQLMQMEPLDYTDLVMYNLNLSNYYKDGHDYVESMSILKSLAKWVDKVEFEPIICDYYLRLAIVHFLLNETKEGNEAIDKGLELMPQGIYPHPIYDDLSDLSCTLAKNGDEVRCKKIFDLMTSYLEKNKGTIEQIFAYNTIANYHRYFGDKDKAFEYFEKLEELHKKRISDLELVQLDVHKQVKEADQEIQKLKKRIQHNDKIYSLEPFTKLLNRSALLKVSSEFIETALKKKDKVGAIFIDIDFFKECNDTYGHSVGDDIIKEVANVCKSEETSNVVFARYGGDEFFGVTKCLEDDEVVEIAKRISQKIRSENIPNEKNPNGHIITLSVGVVNVAITDQTDTIIEIANYADKAAYYAKNKGKNAIYMLKYDTTKEDGQYSEYIKIDF